MVLCSRKQYTEGAVAGSKRAAFGKENRAVLINGQVHLDHSTTVFASSSTVASLSWPNFDRKKTNAVEVKSSLYPLTLSSFSPSATVLRTWKTLWLHVSGFKRTSTIAALWNTSRDRTWGSLILPISSSVELKLRLTCLLTIEFLITLDWPGLTFLKGNAYQQIYLWNFSCVNFILSKVFIDNLKKKCKLYLVSK